MFSNRAHFSLRLWVWFPPEADSVLAVNPMWFTAEKSRGYGGVP